MTTRNFFVILSWTFLLSAPLVSLIMLSIDTPAEAEHFANLCETMHGTVGKVDHRTACVDVVFYKAEKL